MSNFKLEFTLKQHTPIIHFQSEQSGATLRATELKPKLDRFLMEFFKEEKLDYKALLINGQERALDYKVNISPDTSKATAIDARNPLFFGNMGDGKDKEFKQHKNSFKITIFTFKTELKEQIEKHFETFLANTNFGTRQSKGFGGFYLDKPFDSSLIKSKVYSFSSNLNSWDKDIKLFYSFLRQGINVPRGRNLFYCKPAIFLYAKKQGWEWDKKAIKAHFFPNDLASQQKQYNEESPVNYSSPEKMLLRDLFGLSSEQSWMSYKATVKKEHSTIERYKSPITFKFIDNRVYFWADKSFEKMLDKTFEITTRENKPLSLSTPKNFSFDDFFEFVKTIDLSKVVENKFHNTQEYRDLTRMLNNIKASK